MVGPLQGFGPLWQKTFWVRLSGANVSPQEVSKTWREKFPRFWPKGNFFYPSLTGIEPGEVALIDSSLPGGINLSTGVMVIYVDQESFAYITPEGHPVASIITMSAHEKDGVTVAQVQELMRANDPIYEIVGRLAGFKRQEHIWHHTLESLARHFGVRGQAQMVATCVDSKFQWRETKNVWHNAMIRSGVYSLTLPLRWALRLGRTKG